ncbi:hypothetical protein QNA09_00465 (plasmid) [Rhodococcus sp. AH-ZY2]|nr:hypothetical protein [Rhodococcus sp. AH-ZY2]WML61005.1 hypothetical protein QNA09_00465 [Rhodococcus sp. AH-ZY2]
MSSIFVAVSRNRQVPSSVMSRRSRFGARRLPATWVPLPCARCELTHMLRNPVYSGMKTLICTAVFAAAMATGCSSPDETAPTTTRIPSSTSVTSITTAPPTPAAVTTTDPAPEQAPPVPVEPAPAETAAEPYIVSCQIGLGPIETYWSDGSVTGYSDYCQAQHDSVLEAEVAANTPICDGTVCRYPSGAVMPDPNATPSTTTNRPYPTEDEAFIETCMAKSGQSREVCIQQIQEGIDAGNIRVP